MVDPQETLASAALAAGFESLAAGDGAGAERAFRLAVAAAPGEADAHGALGEALLSLGRAAQAAAALAEADRLDPDRPHRLSALATALAEAGDGAGAVAVSRRWTAIRPDSAPALFALADALLAQGDAAAALAPLREAVLLAPDDADGAARLCRVLADRGEPLEGLELAQPALRRAPDHPRLHLALGLAWRRLGEREKAAAAVRRCLALDPDHAEAAALLAALDDDDGENAAPDTAYVRALFDRYAERFDADLVETLGYRVPALLRAAVAETAGEAMAGLDILDLGCGTGLAGVAFAPLARHLAGIDLAPRMIAAARRRQLYHELAVEDLLSRLARERARWDLIIAADVFTYLGDLEPVSRAVAAALRPGGRLAATVETAPGLEGVEVMPSRRVRHGAAHLRACAAAAGLALPLLRPDTLRTEKRQPVPGLVMVMEKPLE